MMRFLVTLLFVGVMTTSALAGLDPAADSFGIYFDVDGNTNCITAPPYVSVAAHIILMNPAGPTDGCEFSVVTAGAQHVVLAMACAFGPGDACLIDGDDHWVVSGWDFPVPPSGAVVLETWTLMLLEPGELLFHIGGTSIPSLPGGLPILTGDGVLRQGAVASGDPALPVAGINAAPCPVSDEASAFGRVKSLFR